MPNQPRIDLSKHQCRTCKHASWRRTDKGALHPGGAGKCTWQLPQLPQLPRAYTWDRVGTTGEPKTRGGYIERRPTVAYAVFTSCSQYQPDVTKR